MTAGRVVLDETEFARLRLLLSRAAGLVFDETRRESLTYSVGERLRATGIASVQDYLDEVCASGSLERQRLIDEVTIQETHFFRNPPQMRALRAHVLPELLRAAAEGSRRVRIWSAGCSTGEEPYTIAMMLRELLPSTAGWDVKVLATDISEHALDAARRGVYGPRAVQLATPEQVARFFTRLPDGQVEVRPEVRELVELRHHNLVLDPAPTDGLDLVLCRNVTIYFSRDTTRALMGRLHGALRDGGYLFLGHSETLWQISEDFRLVSLGSGDDAAFVYRRLDEPADERRAVLPDRRTMQDPRVDPDRRIGSRRVWPGGVRLRSQAERAEPASGSVAVDTAPPADLLPAVRQALSEGRYVDAAQLARLAADVDPLRADVHYLLGLALVDQGLDAEALPALRRAVYLDPDAGLAHFLLAGALARCGDRAAAAREYRAAAQVLSRESGDRAAPELGGRSARELAALCAQLEGQLRAEEER